MCGGARKKTIQKRKLTPEQELMKQKVMGLFSKQNGDPDTFSLHSFSQQKSASELRRTCSKAALAKEASLKEARDKFG